MQSRNDGTDEGGPDGRGALAGGRGRQDRTSGEDGENGHDEVLANEENVAVARPMRAGPTSRIQNRAADRPNGLRERNRSSRTLTAGLRPSRFAKAASSGVSDRIRLTIGMAALPSPAGTEGRGPPLVQVLGDALATLMVDLIAVLPLKERSAARERFAARERLANRLDDQARTPGAGPAAELLSAIAASLMRLER